MRNAHFSTDSALEGAGARLGSRDRARSAPSPGTRITDGHSATRHPRRRRGGSRSPQTSAAGLGAGRSQGRARSRRAGRGTPTSPHSPARPRLRRPTPPCPARGSLCARQGPAATRRGPGAVGGSPRRRQSAAPPRRRRQPLPAPAATPSSLLASTRAVSRHSAPARGGSWTPGGEREAGRRPQCRATARPRPTERDPGPAPQRGLPPFSPHAPRPARGRAAGPQVSSGGTEDGSRGRRSRAGLSFLLGAALRDGRCLAVPERSWVRAGRLRGPFLP